MARDQSKAEVTIAASSTKADTKLLPWKHRIDGSGEMGLNVQMDQTVCDGRRNLTADLLKHHLLLTYL